MKLLQFILACTLIMFLSACSSGSSESDDQENDGAQGPVVVEPDGDGEPDNGDQGPVVVDPDGDGEPDNDDQGPVASDPDGDESPNDNTGQSPVIAEFSATPVITMIDEPVTFSWQIVDSDVEGLRCTIDVNGDGSEEIIIESCASGQSAINYYLVPGSYEPVLTVRDTEGLQATQTTAVTVLPVQVSLAVAETVMAGQRLRYEFTVSNVSQVPLNNVRVLYRVPTGLTFNNRASAIPDADNCFTCAEGSEAEWRFGSIAAGATRSIILNASVLDSVAGGSVIEGKIDVSVDGVGGVVSREQSVLVENRPLASLGISAMRDQVVAGEDIKYSVYVGNISSGNVGNIELRTQLPRETTASAISDGGVVDAATGEVVWNLAQLPVLQTRELNMTVSPPSNVVPGQILRVRSTLTHDGGIEVDAARTEVITVVEQKQPVQISIAPLASPVAAGGRLNYQITVSNTGLVPTTNIGVIMVVPAGVSFDSDDDAFPDASGCFTCAEGSEALWTFSSLPAGASQTIIVNAEVLSGVQAGTLLDSMFFAFADNLAGNITRVRVDGVLNNPTSQLAISSSVEPAVAGQEVLLIVDAGNITSTNLNNTVIRLDIPEGVTVSSISGAGVQSGIDGSISWPSQTLPVLESIRHTVTMATPGDAVSGQILEFRGVLQSDGGPILDATAGQVITISESASPLSVSIVPAASSVSAGERLRYDFRITNESLIPVTNVFLLYRVPPGVSFANRADAEPDASGCFTCSEGSEAVWRFPSIASGETVLIDVNTIVSSQLQGGNLLNANVIVGGDSVNDTIRLSNVVVVD